MDDDTVVPRLYTYNYKESNDLQNPPITSSLDPHRRGYYSESPNSPPYRSATSTGLPEPGKFLTDYSCQSPQDDRPLDGHSDCFASPGNSDPQLHHDSESAQWQLDFDAEEVRRTHQIFSAYLRGQLSNVAKAAIWWSTFGVFAEALTGFPLAVGTTRLVFNLALIFLSPLAGAMAEKADIRFLLTTTTWGRFIVWCILIPVLWGVCTISIHSPMTFYIGFLVLMFLDGAQVSFANIVDIDCGGLDALAQQYGLTIGNFLRDRFNRIHQIVFDLSFIILTPPLAFIIWEIALHTQAVCTVPLVGEATANSIINENMQLDPPKLQWSALNAGLMFTADYKSAQTDVNSNVCGVGDVAVLLGGICSILGGLSLFSIWNYRKFLAQSIPSPAVSEISHDASTIGERSPHMSSDSGAHGRTHQSNMSSWALTCERFKDVKDGFLIILREKALGWRLIFLALETALEDSVVSVVIPQTSLRLVPCFLHRWNLRMIPAEDLKPHVPIVPQELPGGWTLINCVAVCLIAAGKAGGLLAASYMNARWAVPNCISTREPYIKLFRFMFISCASLLFLPLAYYIVVYPNVIVSILTHTSLSIPTSTTVTLIGACILVVLAFFVFFVFSAAPKIGFATLLHTLVLQRDIDTKVFGFVGTCVTLTDAIIILLVNIVFSYFGQSGFFAGLCVISGFYLLHGLCELFIAPRLILYVEDNPSEHNSPEAIMDFPNLVTCRSRSNQYPSLRRPNSDGVVLCESEEDDRHHHWDGRSLKSGSPLDALQTLVQSSPTEDRNELEQQQQTLTGKGWQQYATSSTRNIGSWADARD